MKPVLLLVILSTLLSCTKEEISLSLIPQPNSIQVESNFCQFKSIDVESIDDTYLKRILLKGLNQKGIQADEKGISLILTQDFDLEDEAYALVVSKDKIKINASDYNGFVYGIQSLLQILDQASKNGETLKIPRLRIDDAPAFKWRGMHLDVCRHYFEVDFIKKMLDAMAMHKLNTFHWHLTEDQGWRIEIEKYPLLTEISAWRDESVVGHIATEPIQYDGQRYGGFYTKAQIKEVVDYASKLGITVVPEIEMPGHAVAALLAYPELSCTGKPIPFNDWGVSDDVYCAGNEKTFEFLENVLEEVVELFPGEYVHIGGDECPKTKWEVCPKCQKRIKDEGLKDEHELQSYFVQRMEKFLNSKGKKLIGWDEILEGGLADNAAVMSWRGEQGGIDAAEQGHHVVMTPNDICYLDHYQSNYNEPLAIAGLTTVEDIYNWTVIPEKLGEENHHFVLGAQGNVWTEYIPTPEHAEYMIYPRLCALAEKVWTNESNQNFESFSKRLITHYDRLEAMDLNFRIPFPNVEMYNPIIHENQLIDLSNGVNTASIYYTIDGTEPNENSLLFEEPFVLELREPITLKAIAVMPSGRKSTMVQGKYELQNYRTGDEGKFIPGLVFKRYDKNFQSAFDVKGVPNKTGVLTDKLVIPNGDRKGNFGMEFMGWFEAPKEGMYTFYMDVKDGGLLYLGDQLIIDNDGFKYNMERSGKFPLKAGKHTITIKYFMGRGWNSLRLRYAVDGGEIVPVTIDMFYTRGN